VSLTEVDGRFRLDPWRLPADGEGHLDEKVMAHKSWKARLFCSVSNGGNSFGASLNANDIRGLLS
jgi:hypothetical protein